MEQRIDRHRVTYVGHATVLIELDGVRILTDPVLRWHVGPLWRYAPPVDPGIWRDLDAVIISHLHFDHFDTPSLRLVSPDVPVIVPVGAGGLAEKTGLRNVREAAPGDTIPLGGLTIEVTPAAHSGFRPPRGPNAGCLGCRVVGSQTIYFAGDTALFPEMADMAGDLDLALLPVWGWGPTLGPGHMDPAQATAAARLLKPRMAVPIHWGTLYPAGLRYLKPMKLITPPHEFAEAMAQVAPATKVQLLAPGGSMNLTMRVQEDGISDPRGDREQALRP